MNQLSDKELIDELKRRFSENNKTIEELQRITKELQVVNKKLEESEALKSHFISNITNEIINPFTSIIGLSKNILSVDKENWKKVISMVALIHSEAFNLDFQLRNIFVAAKIEAGEISPEIMNVDVEGLVKSIIDSFELEARKKDIKFEFEFKIEKEDKPFRFKTDPEKIKLILANLLSNAIKYSHPRGIIKIVINREDNSRLCFIVQDFGTGISDENQKIIFDRFKRIDTGINSLNRGHGLGLSINKALLDLLNGTIEIKSTKDKGATFIFCIPEPDVDTGGTSTSGDDFIFEEGEIF